MKLGIGIAVILVSSLVQASPMWGENTDLRRKINHRQKPLQVFHKRDISRDPIVKFDYPIQYNRQVQFWIRHFQTEGRRVFNGWLRRSQKYMPHVQKILREQGLPQDLAYIPMIESGFVSHARSPAAAVGPWQFIGETGQRYGLTTSWWLDERMDFEKSTKAAAKYFRYLYSIFNCWNLAAAGYNTGENRIIRLVEKHNTRDFWAISRYGGLYQETKNYVPKLIATMLIAKAPQLYGFKVPRMMPLVYERLDVPGGTRLDFISRKSGINRELLKDLNPELIRGYIPFSVVSRTIRVPPGAGIRISRAINAQLVTANDHFFPTDRN
jgi:membrane-bound lytic murein transglycosylase D